MGITKSTVRVGQKPPIVEFRNIKEMFFIILIIILLCFVGVVIGINIDSNREKKIVNEIKKDPFVLDAELFYFDEVLSETFNIEIKFKNEGNLRIYNISKSGKEVKNRLMRIDTVDGYKLTFYSLNEDNIIFNEGLEIWSAAINIQLNDIFDVVRYYSKISEYVENCINLSNHKTEGDVFLQTLRKVIASELLTNKIMINEQEIFLLKEAPSTRWPFFTTEKYAEINR